MTKNLFAQTIPDKVFGTNFKNPVKLGRNRKYLFIDIYLKAV